MSATGGGGSRRHEKHGDGGDMINEEDTTTARDAHWLTSFGRARFCLPLCSARDKSEFQNYLRKINCGLPLPDALQEPQHRGCNWSAMSPSRRASRDPRHAAPRPPSGFQRQPPETDRRRSISNISAAVLRPSLITAIGISSSSLIPDLSAT